MNRTQIQKKQPARRSRGLGWQIPAALACGIALWGRFSGAANAPSIACAALAGLVLALSVVLALRSEPR